MSDPSAFAFAFAFAQPWRPLLALAGIRPATSGVRVGDDGLSVRYGRWRLHSPLDNITGAQIAGPYRWYRVIGPHLSVADRGVSFGTTTAAGVCITLATPVPGLDRTGRLLHPNLTVTVEHPDALVNALRARGVADR